MIAPVDTQQAVANLRDTISKALGTLGVVGASVAVVHEDRLLLCEGFGARDLGRRAPVDAQTLFAIGSSTKAFTTLSVALLADDGRVDWDAPVRTYLPEFALKDPVASAEVTARDLGCHRVGLPRHDAVWYKSDLTRAEIVARLRYLEPNRPFRTTFQYQNMMFTTLGYLVERLSGKTWEEFARDRILGPLGMARTNFSVRHSQADPNTARPHAEKDGTTRELPFAEIDAVGPAGSINSCARDLAQWLRLHLGSGEVDGARIVSAAALGNLHARNIVLPESGEDTRRRAPAYALGWFTEVYQGIPVVHHGGNIDGFSALVLLVPEHHLGVAVLCNQEISVLPAAVAYAAVDGLLGLEPRDWSAYLKAARDRLLGAARQAGDFSAERVPGTSTTHPLDAYAGEYAHPAYGTVMIERTPDGLSLRYHMWPEPLPLEHFHYDMFVARAELESVPMALRVPFRLGLDGAVESFEAQVEPMTPPATFCRTVAAPVLSAKDLARYAGRYTLAGAQTVQVEVVGEGALAATVAGQPPLQLFPDAPHRFSPKGIPGFHVQFDVDPDGTCRAGRVVTANGVLALARVTEG